jgi:hypothetical protein
VRSRRDPFKDARGNGAPRGLLTVLYYVPRVCVRVASTRAIPRVDDARH